MLIRATVIYSGHVQGVGFRATARSVAQRFAVEGFVRNLRDGSVECVVEGDKTDVDRYLAAVENAMEGFVADAKREESAATGEFTGQGLEVRR